MECVSRGPSLAGLPGSVGVGMDFGPPPPSHPWGGQGVRGFAGGVHSTQGGQELAALWGCGGHAHCPCAALPRAWRVKPLFSPPQRLPGARRHRRRGQVPELHGRRRGLCGPPAPGRPASLPAPFLCCEWAPPGRDGA